MMDVVKEVATGSSSVDEILFQSFSFVAYSSSQDGGSLQCTRALILGLRVPLVLL